MRTRARAGALIVAAAIGLAGAISLVVTDRDQPAAAAPLTNPVAQRAGINPGSSILWESPADQNRDLDAIAATGARWVSVDVDWNSIQGNGPNSWWWDATDQFVHAARARGLTIHGGLAYSPPWARPASCPPNTTHCLPVDPGDFAGFAKAAVARYGSRATDPSLRGSILAWSIWNEPNHTPFALPNPDPVQYTRLLGATYPLIKQADPTAIVLTGGAAPAPDTPPSEYSPPTWLQAIYAQIRADGGNPDNYFDAVGAHPYSFPTNPLSAQSWSTLGQVLALHNVMVKNGDGDKLIWGTESGGPTGTAPHYALTDAQQAQWVHDYYAGWNSAQFRNITGPLFWFQHRDTGTNPADWSGQMGLLRKDWSQKPAYGAYVDTMRAANTRVTPVKGKRTATSPAGGYYVLSSDGVVTAKNGAPYFGSPDFGFDIARGLAVMPDGQGYVVLDGWGGLHRYGSARTGAVGAARAPYWQGWDIARDVAITPDGQGLAVLDGFGGVHTSGDAPRLRLDYWNGWDIARSFAFSPSGRGVYLLDGFGGVHAAGDAVPRGGSYWNGWDVARDIIVSASGRGYAVLDALGGVHVTGDMPAPGYNPAYPSRQANGITQLDGGYVVTN